MMVDPEEISLCLWYPDDEPHSCGYCKNNVGSVHSGMTTKTLTVEDYQDLIDRGWRRSGTYCYKPTMNKTCCPQYTIRCDTSNFSLNKSHKKIIKKFKRFINDGVMNKSNTAAPQDDESHDCHVQPRICDKQIDFSKVITGFKNASEVVEQQGKDDNLMENGVEQIISHNQNPSIAETSKQNELPEFARNSKKLFKEGRGADKTKPPCKKAKLLRMERKKEKISQAIQEIKSPNKTNITQKTLAQFLEEIPPTSKHIFKLKLIKMGTVTEDWKNDLNIEFELYKKYQTVIHNDPPTKLELHSFIRFLVNTPLKYKTFPNGIDGPGYGSFHQQYWLDDKLIAVGVIDILPRCVSSVYFFYDPDYRDLTLGTYGSLREVQFTQDLQHKLPELRYYYMGFYIHSCPKMRYKGKLVPSYLLCPETYVWLPIESCLPKLEVSKYSRLNEDPNTSDENACSESDVKRIMIVHKYKCMHVSDLVRLFGEEIDDFRKLGKLIGRKAARNIHFWVS